MAMRRLCSIHKREKKKDTRLKTALAFPPPPLLSFHLARNRLWPEFDSFKLCPPPLWDTRSHSQRKPQIAPPLDDDYDILSPKKPKKDTCPFEVLRGSRAGRQSHRALYVLGLWCWEERRAESASRKKEGKKSEWMDGWD